MYSAEFPNRVTFNRMLRSFCDTRSYRLGIVREDDIFRYDITHPEFTYKEKFSYFIHIDSFARDNLYSRFKDATELVEKHFDMIARKKSREIWPGRKPWDEDGYFGGYVYLSTADHRKAVIDTDVAHMWPKINPFVEYCKADVEATKRMAKFFDPDKTPEIKDVIFNYPATIVLWADGTKTVVKAHDDDVYDPEKGLAMAICKKIGGNKWSYYNKFKHWLKKAKKED